MKIQQEVRRFVVVAVVVVFQSQSLVLNYVFKITYGYTNIWERAPYTVHIYLK